MQSNKASKKTRKDVSEPVAQAGTEVSALTEKTAKPRASKSPLSKSEAGETASAMRHRKAATVNVPEVSVTEPVAAPKVMAAAAGIGSSAAVVIEPVGVVAAPVASSRPEVSPEQVQDLAYQYWVAEGRPHGNHFEHWLRAERELGIARNADSEV